jgi:hypothetical protein
MLCTFARYAALFRHFINFLYFSLHFSFIVVYDAADFLKKRRKHGTPQMLLCLKRLWNERQVCWVRTTMDGMNDTLNRGMIDKIGKRSRRICAWFTRQIRDAIEPLKFQVKETATLLEFGNQKEFAHMTCVQMRVSMQRLGRQLGKLRHHRCHVRPASKGFQR